MDRFADRSLRPSTLVPAHVVSNGSNQGPLPLALKRAVFVTGIEPMFGPLYLASSTPSHTKLAASEGRRDPVCRGQRPRCPAGQGVGPSTPVAYE